MKKAVKAGLGATVIRNATLRDVSGIVALQRSAAKENAILGYVPDAPDEWRKRDLAWTFVAVFETQPVGFIHCTPRAYSGECVFRPEARILEITDLVVEKSARRARLGNRLIAAAQERARSDGFTHLRVYSAAKRFDEIVRFYRNSGFTPWYLEMTQEL